MTFALSGMRFHKLHWLLAMAVLITAPAQGLDRSELTALLEQTREKYDMPGLRAAVKFADGSIVLAAVGQADLEADIPLDDVVGMPGGSTGKTFVAAIALMLVEEGAMSLDDRVARWLGNEPWFDRLPNSERILVRHLLSHSSGLRDYPGSIAFQAAMVFRVISKGSAYFEPEELIGYAARRRARFTPGEGYDYSDAGYLVLGRLIEEVSGRRYYDLLQERILDPLMLDEVRTAEMSALPGITPGYTGGARNLREDGRMKFDPSSEWTGGGLTTNPRMLVQFFAALANGEVVSSDSLNLMLDSGWRNPNSPGSHYGFGVFVYGGGVAFGHGGLWPGYRTHVTHYRSSGLTVAVQTNRDGRLSLEALVESIAALAAQ